MSTRTDLPGLLAAAELTAYRLRAELAAAALAADAPGLAELRAYLSNLSDDAACAWLAVRGARWTSTEPAAAATPRPEPTREPPLCALDGCRRPATTASSHCGQHDAELRAELERAPGDTPLRPLPLAPGEADDFAAAVWRCDHCAAEVEAVLRPVCRVCGTRSTQPVRRLPEQPEGAHHA